METVGQVAGVNVDDGDVGNRVSPDDSAFKGATVLQGHFYPIGPVNYVGIGDDLACLRW